jgi:glycosyltransferase involved in cell wall biosynthesis
MRFVGVKDNFVRIVSDKPFESTNLKAIPVPKSLSKISDDDLIIHCQEFNNHLKYKFEAKPIHQLKIAFVSNFKMSCGIATYADKLWSKIIPKVKSAKLFIENQKFTDNLYNLDQYILSPNQVVPCWERGKPLNNLIDEIKAYSPDIIWIQHEFGLFPNAAHWLNLMSQLSNFRIIVTQHSIYHHQDKSICEAAMPEIVAHLEGGKNVLVNEKGLNQKISVIPHGCDDFDDQKLWNIYRTKNTFIQFGFGFRYKGFENSIEAVAILKEKYPDIFFTALFSESNDTSYHQSYYLELKSLIEKLNVQDNVAIIRGFQSDESLRSYLKTNRVAVFPYVSQPGHEVFGASGAARMAMSANIPVITSSVPHFSDLPTIKADSSQNIAHQLDVLFSKDSNIKKQLLIQKNYVLENSWENVANKYIKLFEGF